MSLTIAQRIAKVKVLLYIYHEQVKVTEQLVAMNVQLSRDEVYKADLPTREYNYRKTITVNHNDPLPTDYVAYGNNAWCTVDGNIATISYLDIQEVAGARTNPFMAALADTPKLYFCDQKIKFLPDAVPLAGVNFEYYWRPVDLFASDDTIGDTTTDNMPEDTEYAIVRGAAERCLQMLMGKEQAMQLIQQAMNESAENIDKFYADFFSSEMQGVTTR